MKLKSNIDTNLIDIAETEIFQILLNQHHQATNKQLDSNHVNLKIIKMIRFLCILLSILSVIYSILPIINPNSCSTLTLIQSIGYTLSFIMIGLVFYFFPLIISKSQNFGNNWSKTIVIKSCKYISKKCVKQAKELAPYQAKYEIKEGIITYYRIKDDNYKLAWSKKLKGITICGQKVTIFFKNWTSVQPTIIILHEDYHQLKEVLKDQNIDFISRNMIAKK